MPRGRDWPVEHRREGGSTNRVGKRTECTRQVLREAEDALRRADELDRSAEQRDGIEQPITETLGEQPDRTGYRRASSRSDRRRSRPGCERRRAPARVSGGSAGHARAGTRCARAALRSSARAPRWAARRAPPNRHTERSRFRPRGTSCRVETVWSRSLAWRGLCHRVQ